MLLLKAFQLKYSIAERQLLDIQELKIYRQDRIGLIGINGSGKTTLLKALANEQQIETGTIIHHASYAWIPQWKDNNTSESGGEVTQRYIQEALNKHPDLLLADEPTTNLDTINIEELESSLQEWDGAFIIVSHDRVFLDALCTTIWELDDGKLTIYKGNYSDYVEQKKHERRNQELAYEKYVREKKQLENAIQLKEIKANRATKKPKRVSNSEASIIGAKPYYANKQKKLRKTAKALETRLEKLEVVEKTKENPSLKMDVFNHEHFHRRIILRIEDVSAAIEDRILWKHANFQVYGGDKLAIIGDNGVGKTTFLRKIIQQDEGISLSPAVKIGYFSQNLNTLNEKQTILENVQISSVQSEALIRTVLARMNFVKDDVYKTVHVLSGGERVKVALAKVLLSEANILILDEPTNYLDVNAMEALESLLVEYEGTVIYVSHDRRFIEKTATRIIEIVEQKVKVFEGTYQQFIESKKTKPKEDNRDQLLLIETQITEVLSRLSIEPSAALENEFQQLLQKKRDIQNN
ncbi:Vga family ABC-F type ribosomal protection protein [Ornithinibacillus sp. 4-3]|uniref:Vga family ABC-F type ribosomal protection protein n=1 Tax=Ornithinibacillus sp. 4-3 TaxID=3231488 RepID=A0AB39HMH3_9BACI